MEHGTNARRIRGADCWADACIKDIQENSFHLDVVISDCRFPNEVMKMRYQWLDDNVTTSWIDRPGIVRDPGHESENSLFPEMCDYVITNSGSKALLANKLYLIIQHTRLQ